MNLSKQRGVLIFLAGQFFFLWYFFGPSLNDVQSNQTTLPNAQHYSKVNVPKETDSRTAFFEGLQTWALENGLKSPKLKLKFTEKGQTLIADEDIPKGVLFRVPFDMLISHVLNRRDSVWNSVGWQTIRKEGFDAVDIEAVYLLYEIQLGEESWFRHYTKGLTPYEEISLPNFWDEEDFNLIERFRDTILSETDVSAGYKKVKRLQEAHPHIFDKNVFTYQNYKRVCAHLWSHTFNVYKDSRYSFVMVPYVDLMNHDPYMETWWTIDEMKREWKIFTDRNFKKGDELVINYGSMPNSRILQWFGFSLEDNPHDVFYIDLLKDGFRSSSIPKLPLLRKLNCHDWIELQIGKYEQRGKLLDCARVAVYQEAHDDPFPKPHSTRVKRLGCKNEQAALDFVLSNLKSYLDEYSTTVEEDDAILRQGRYRNWHAKIAIIARKGQKEILQYHFKNITELLEEERRICEETI